METLILKKGFWSNLLLFTSLLLTTFAVGHNHWPTEHRGIKPVSATIYPDKDDYHPGDTLRLYGSGWQPGETVSLHFDEMPAVCANGHNRSTIADANGDIYYDQFYFNSYHLGVRFSVTATGLSSGLQAETFFTDGSLTIAPNTSCGVGGQVTITLNTNALNTSQPMRLFKGVSPGGVLVYTFTSSNLTYTIPNVQLSDAGDYYYTATRTNGNPETGTGTLYVNVISNNSVSSDQTICSGNTPSILNGSTASAIIGSVSYRWRSSSDGITFSDIGGSSGAGQNYSPGSLAASTWYQRRVSVSGTNSGNCTSISNTIKITVNPAPTAVLSSANNSNICLGDSVTLSIALTGSGTISGLLSDGTLFSGSGGNTLTIIKTPSNNITYSISSLTDGACPGSFSGTKSFTIQGKYVVDAGENQTICPNATASLNGSVTGPSPTLLWMTSGNGTFSSSSSSATVYTPSSDDIAAGSVTLSFKASGTGACDATDTMLLTIHDSVPPVLSAGGAQNVSLDSDCKIEIPDVTGSAVDNCGAVSIVQVPAAGEFVSTSHNATVAVTVTATDGSGLTDTETVILTAQDSIAPAIDCPSDISQNNDAGLCSAIVNYTAPVGTDNCTGASTVQTAGLASGAAFPVGETVNTFEVTDAAGNTSSCSFTVTVSDSEAPAIDCPLDISQNNDAGLCSAIVNYTAPVGTDNCAGASTVQTAGLASGAAFPVGETVNTFEVTDAAGNTSSCSFTVTVSDSEAPAIDCPVDISQNNDAGLCSAIVNYTAPVGTDNCTGASTVQTAGLASGAAFPVGETVNTFEVTDAAGNTSSCSFTVTVSDSEAPAIDCPVDISQNNDAGLCSAIVNYTAPVGTDNCAGASTVQTAGLASGAAFPVGETVNTFEVTDAAGNTSSCSFTVTVSDSEAPAIDCPSDIHLSACESTASWSVPSATDNCLGAEVTQTAGPPSGSTFDNGSSTTIEYTVTDAGGNTDTCSFNVTRQSSLSASCSNTNNILYYGYNGDQTSTITVNPSGGEGPYTVSITMNRPLMCNVITNAGDELWVAGPNTSASSNTSCPTSGSPSVNPISTSTNTIIASAGYSLNVTLMADATFTATVTDSNGCTAVCTTTIFADDVRCFAGNSGVPKVKLCHKTGSAKNPCVNICVDQSAVSEHMAHGDFFGACNATCTPSGASGKPEDLFTVKAYPNPSSNQFTFEIESDSKETIDIELYDVAGKLVKQIKNSTTNVITFGEDLPRGLYLAAVQQGVNQKTLRILKE